MEGGAKFPTGESPLSIIPFAPGWNRRVPLQISSQVILPTQLILEPPSNCDFYDLARIICEMLDLVKEIGVEMNRDFHLFWGRFRLDGRLSHRGVSD